MKKKNQKSFTLVELLVAMAIFSIIVGITSTLFISALQAQRNSLASQELFNQTSYIMEYMGRAIRMAQKDLTGDCITARLNYQRTTSGTGGIKFKNYNGQCQEFFRECSAGVCRLRERKGINIYDLTPNELNVELFNIAPSDSSWQQPPTDTNQPRVTLTLKIKRKGQKPEEQPEIQIQTTLSQRNLDIEKYE